MDKIHLTAKSVAALQFDPAGKATQIVWDSKLEGFGIRLTPKGAKLVTVRAWAKAQRREYLASLGRLERFVDISVARQKARETIAALAGLKPGEAPAHLAARQEAARVAAERASAKPPARALTFSTVLDDYIDRSLVPLIAAGKRKPRTEADFRYYAKRLTKYLGDVPVDGYTRRDAKALYELLGTSGRGKKFVTVNRLFAFLRAAVSFAINDDVLPPTYANPFRGWKRVPERPREEVLGDKQLGAFLAAFDRLEDPVVRNYLRLLGSTGQRPGELRRILWDDVVLDGERPQFTIRCSKNHRDVEVPIDASEVIHFRELLKYRLAGNPHVFPSRIRARKGVEEPQPMPAPNRVWRALRSAAGFPGLHMHDLKATALTNLARAGFTTEMLMQHGNHADASTTMRYVRLAKDSANRDKIRDARAEIIAKARQSAMPRDGATVTDIGQAREARAG